MNQVRIPDDLNETLKNAAVISKRSVTKEVEVRLRQSIDEDNMSSKTVTEKTKKKGKKWRY